jgi:hypothetical protein
MSGSRYVLFKLEIGESLSVCRKKSGMWKNPYKQCLTSNFGVYCLLCTFYKNTHWYNHKKTDQYEFDCVEDKISKNTRESLTGDLQIGQSLDLRLSPTFNLGFHYG